jgi:hypothetical protein
MRFPDPERLWHAAPAALLAALLAGCATHVRAPAPAPEPRHAEQPTDTGLPAGAARVLAQRFPALHPVGHSAGHLQVDDADDLAVVLAPQGQSGEPIVAVLVTGAPGEYRVATVSRPVAPGCDTCTTTVDIARKLLSVHVMRPSDPEFQRVTWQFGYTDDALRLVNVTAAQPAGDDPIAHGYAISTNLLTGTKVDTLDPTQADPSRRRELRSSVPLRHGIAFDAFDFTPQALGPELRRLPPSAFEPQDALPAAAVALLRKSFPGASLTGRSAGPLRADGLRDLVVVLDPAGNGDTDTTLALLLAQPDGGFRLGATSGPLTRDCGGCDVQVQIAHRALVVQTTSVDGGVTHIVGWQFMAAPRDRSGALRLVGVRTVLASRSGDDSHRYVNTANLLTGDKLDVVEDVVRGHRKRTERASKVAVRATIPFAGFAFDAGKFDAETKRELAP